jgi:tetratricopeptide (TPR) repeat protein
MINILFRKNIYLLAGVLFFTSLSIDVTAQGDKYGDNPTECQMHLSLYRESFKQWKNSNFAGDAHEFLESWRYCFFNCPKSSEYLYLDGVSIMENLAANATDPQVRAKYADTIEIIFNNRMQYFPNDSRTKQSQEGSLLWRKALSLAQWAPERVERIYNDLKRAIELDVTDMPSAPLPYYLRATIDMANADKIDKSLIIENYDRLSNMVEINIKKATDAADEQLTEEWTFTMRQLEQLIEPYASCDDLVEIFQKKFDENPQDVETLRKITSTLDKNKCTNSALFMKASENLFKLDPTPESASMMAKNYIRNNEYDKAIKAMEDVIKLTQDNALRYKTEYELIQVLLMQKRYSQARDHASKALQLRPNSGEILLLIGKMYAASSDMCGDDEISKKSVFWAAVDKFNEAKRVDPSVAEEANKLISTYRQYFPAAEKLFFYSMTVGSSYKVECWINETTTIRSAD